MNDRIKILFILFLYFSLEAINRTIEPTEDMPDPLRVDLTEDEMKTALSKLYDDTTSGYSEGNLKT